jgi:hypothetical protein
LRLFFGPEYSESYPDEPTLDFEFALKTKRDFDLVPLLRLLGLMSEPNSTGKDPLNPESVEESADRLIEHWGTDVRGLVCDVLRTARMEAHRCDVIARERSASARAREEEVEGEKRALLASFARELRREARGFRRGERPPTREHCRAEGWCGVSQQVLSWVLGVGGACGMWLAGRKSWTGWAVGLAMQPVWLLFAWRAHAWGLIVSPLLYGSVYARNLARWHRERGSREYPWEFNAGRLSLRWWPRNLSPWHWGLCRSTGVDEFRAVLSISVGPIQFVRFPA